MKVILNEHNHYVLRFDATEDIMLLLPTFAKEQNISSATFQIIGASVSVTLSYYNLSEKHYQDRILSEEMEIVSVTGNIAWMDDKPIIHAHGVFATKDYSTVGGHIKSLIVSATGEVSLQTYKASMKRSFDAETGLNLLD